MQNLRVLAAAGPFRVALIGVGGHGGTHLRCLDALHKDGVGQLVAVADPFVEKQVDLHARLTGSGVRWHRDYRQMLAQEKNLDMVIISTPIPLHEEMTRQALEHSTASIYLEKPPVPTLRQLEQLVALDTARRVHVGFHMLAWRPFRELKTLAHSGKLGRIRRITAGAAWPRPDAYYERTSWAGRLVVNGGTPVFDGPATNALAHLVHSVMFIANPEEGRYDRPVEIRGEFYRARPIESYDAACLGGRFASGIEYAIAVAHCTREQQDYTLCVEGEAGSARLSKNGDRLETNFSDGFPLDAEAEYDLPRQTILCAREGRPPVSSLADCLGYSEVTCGGLLSSGNIHTIPARFVTPHGAGDPTKAVRHVEEIAPAVRRTVETGLLWSEQGIPWACTPQPVAASSLQQRDFDLARFVEPPMPV